MKETEPALRSDMDSARVRCQQCGAEDEIVQYHCFDLTRRPGQRETLRSGAFFHWRCPQCGAETDFAYPCWYLNPEESMAAVLCPGLDSRDGNAAQRMAEMNRHLTDLALPGLVHRAAGTFYAFQELDRIAGTGLDDRVLQLLKPLLIGQLQSAGEEIWNGFFTGVLLPGVDAPLPAHGVLRVSLNGAKEAPEQETIYCFDIHRTDRTVLHTGVNDGAYHLCAQLLEQAGYGPDDGRFHLYDLNWAIGIHNQDLSAQEGGVQ